MLWPFKKRWGGRYRVVEFTRANGKPVFHLQRKVQSVGGRVWQMIEEHYNFDAATKAADEKWDARIVRRRVVAK